MIGYEDIIDDFETVSLSHKQVNDFGYGDPWEINKKEYKYPLVFLTDSISRLNGGTFMAGFNMLVMDKSTHDEANEKKILSNCLFIANDIVGKMVYYNEGYTINTDNMEFKVFTNSFSDDDAGWKVEIDIQFGDGLNSCDSPFE